MNSINETIVSIEQNINKINFRYQENCSKIDKLILDRSTKKAIYNRSLNNYNNTSRDLIILHKELESLHKKKNKLNKIRANIISSINDDFFKYFKQTISTLKIKYLNFLMSYLFFDITDQKILNKIISAEDLKILMNDSHIPYKENIRNSQIYKNKLQSLKTNSNSSSISFPFNLIFDYISFNFAEEDVSILIENQLRLINRSHETSVQFFQEAKQTEDEIIKIDLKINFINSNQEMIQKITNKHEEIMAILDNTDKISRLKEFSSFLGNFLKEGFNSNISSEQCNIQCLTLRSEYSEDCPDKNRISFLNFENYEENKNENEKIVFTKETRTDELKTPQSANSKNFKKNLNLFKQSNSQIHLKTKPIKNRLNLNKHNSEAVKESHNKNITKYPSKIKTDLSISSNLRVDVRSNHISSFSDNYQKNKKSINAKSTNNLEIKENFFEEEKIIFKDKKGGIKKIDVFKGSGDDNFFNAPPRTILQTINSSPGNPLNISLNKKSSSSEFFTYYFVPEKNNLFLSNNLSSFNQEAEKESLSVNTDNQFHKTTPSQNCFVYNSLDFDKSDFTSDELLSPRKNKIVVKEPRLILDKIEKKVTNKSNKNHAKLDNKIVKDYGCCNSCV